MSEINKIDFETLWNNLEIIIERKIRQLGKEIDKENSKFRISLQHALYNKRDAYEEILELLGDLKCGEHEPDNLNYTKMWTDLKHKVTYDLKYHKSGEMQSISESVMGEVLCTKILEYMNKIEGVM